MIVDRLDHAGDLRGAAHARHQEPGVADRLTVGLEHLLQVIAPEDKGIRIMLGRNFTDQYEAQRKMTGVGAAQHDLLADLPSVVLHQQRAGPGRAPLLAEGRQCRPRNAIVGHHVGHYGIHRTHGERQNHVLGIAVGPKPSRKRQTGLDPWRAQNLVAVTCRKPIPGTGAVVDQDPQTGRGILDDLIHRSRHRHQHGEDQR